MKIGTQLFVALLVLLLAVPAIVKMIPSQTGNNWTQPEARSEDFHTSIVEIEGKRYKVIKTPIVNGAWQTVALLPE
jgi:hypothetical protein